jgi:stage V sporulation protein AB
VRSFILGIIGVSFGLMAAAGVFAVLVAVGLVPRFAGKTHTANKVFLYEEMVVFGAVIGGALSLFPEYCQLGFFLQQNFAEKRIWWDALGRGIQAVYGFFSGMFIGCLALAIAEMLDSIPIVARRVSLRHGLGLVILSMAAGKVSGSLFYFWHEMHRVVQ